MFPATVWMLPAWPAGTAARAAVRTPTPEPTIRPVITVAKPRRARTAHRRLRCPNIVLLLGFEDPGATGAPKAPLPRRTSHRARPFGGREDVEWDYSTGPLDPFRVEGFLKAV